MEMIRTKLKTLSMAVYRLIMMLLMVVVLFAVLKFSYAWFSNNKSVQANGMAVGAEAPDVLCVYQDENGTQELYRAEEDPKRSNISINPEILDEASQPTNKIAPGSYGSFSVWVCYNPYQTDAYRLKLTLDVLPDNNAVNNGYVQENPSNDDKECIRYGKTHIAFFRNYNEETKTYSGWIPAGTETDWQNDVIEEASEGERIQVRIYWLWIESFNDISGESGSIEAADLERIRASYSAEANQNQWFAGEYSDADLQRNIDAYNSADCNLANAVKYLIFSMDFEAVNAD